MKMADANPPSSQHMSKELNPPLSLSLKTADENPPLPSPEKPSVVNAETLRLLGNATPSSNNAPSTSASVSIATGSRRRRPTSWKRNVPQSAKAQKERENRNNLKSSYQRRPKLTVPEQSRSHGENFAEGALVRWIQKSVIEDILKSVVWIVEDEDCVKVKVKMMDRDGQPIRMTVSIRAGDVVYNKYQDRGTIISFDDSGQALVRSSTGVKRYDPAKLRKDPCCFFTQDDLKRRFRTACKLQGGDSHEISSYTFKALILQLAEDSGQQTYPTDNELNLAFELCDQDRKMGTINTDEFVRMYKDIQGGGISGLSQSSAYAKLTVSTSEALRKSKEAYKRRPKTTRPSTPTCQKRTVKPPPSMEHLPKSPRQLFLAYLRYYDLDDDDALEKLARLEITTLGSLKGRSKEHLCEAGFKLIQARKLVEMSALHRTYCRRAADDAGNTTMTIESAKVKKRRQKERRA